LTPQQVNGSAVNFGDLSMYSGAAFIPDGDYIVYHDVVLHQAVDKNTGVNKGKARLGVMVTFFLKANPTEDTKLEQFYSMGSKADETFAPNPETGKGVVIKPGGKLSNFNDKTNWFMYLNSWAQSGMQPGTFTNDLSVLDGAWVHITNVDEPAERASFQSATSEVAQDQRKPGKIAVVSEILEGGAPWEGGGGMTVPAAAPAKAVTAKAPVRAASAPRPVAPAPIPVNNGAAVDEDLRSHAINGISECITKKPNGIARLALKLDTAKFLEKNANKDIASAVSVAYFDPAGETALSSLLGELGYSIQGAMIKPTVA
jgi:hypothetical protein